MRVHGEENINLTLIQILSLVKKKKGKKKKRGSFWNSINKTETILLPVVKDSLTADGVLNTSNNLS